MKRVFCTLFVILIGSQVFASIQLQVCDPNSLEQINLPEIIVGYDPNTNEPNVFLDVMAGMNISILVHFDANEVEASECIWSGGLFIRDEDRAFGQLTAREGNLRNRYYEPDSLDNDLDYDPEYLTGQYFIGSCLEAAGPYAYILEWKDSHIWGFDCYTDDFERYPGNWFVLDYQALKPGVCTIGFYDHSESDWAIVDPNLSIRLLITPTRDLEPDTIVNFRDFVIFAANWNQKTDSDDPNQFNPADFSRDGFVGLEDVVMFADYWLWGTPGWKPAEKPVVQQEPLADPIVYDVLYSLTCDPNASPFTDPNTLSDANSLPSEITLEVGDSVRLYIDKSSTYEIVKIFDMDVTLSDPNLGTIDNTDGGTAEILAYPRMEGFDWIGTATEQSEGIGFFAANVEPVWDGDMASFVYTATQVGTVKVDLISYASWPDAKLKPLIIHQVLPVIPMLQQAYSESPDLQQSVSQEEWDAFIESVEESTQQ